MSDCDRLLEVLRDGKPHRHHELYALSMIVHSRVAELRKRGHVIEAWRERHLGVNGRPSWTYWYRLAAPSLSDPADPPTRPDSRAEGSFSDHVDAAGDRSAGSESERSLMLAAGTPLQGDPLPTGSAHSPPGVLAASINDQLDLFGTATRGGPAWA